MTIVWEDVRYLEAVERTGSVGEAARQLGVAASTVYRRIGALESAVGHPCLARGPGPTALTATGAELAGVGRRTREEISGVVGRVRAQETAIAGEVSLTTVAALLPFLVEPIAALGARHPLRITITLADSGPSVRDREVDIAVGVMRRPPQGCWGRRLGSLPYGVYGTAAAVARSPAPRWVARALGESYSPESAWEREHATDVAARASFDALVSLVAGGVGLGLIPRAIASLHPQLVEVPEHRAAVASLERTAWILTHPDLRKTPRVTAVMDALTKRFQAVLGERAQRPGTGRSRATGS